MRRASIISALFASVASLGLAGCNAGPQPGLVELQLTGADNYQLFSLPTTTTQPQPQTEPGDYGVVSAVVIVNEIDARVDGKWQTLVPTQQSIDLLKLDNKTITSLGIGALPTGNIDKLRLVLDEIGDYVVLKTGQKKPLEVPVNGVVDITGKLDLDACASGIVILDFDPKIKVEDEPGRREYELLCKARIKTEEIKGACGGGGSAGGGGGGAGGGGGGGGVTCGAMQCTTGQICVNNMTQCADPCTSGASCPDPAKPVCIIVNGTDTCVAK